MKNICVRKDNLFLDINSKKSAESNIKNIQNIINNSTAKQIYINLCGLNMFDAIKIASLICAYGLADDTTRKFEIFADNKIVMGHIKLLGLSNMNVRMEMEKEALIAF